MLTIDKIKGIIFDYGGTIDSNGLHWAEVIWKAYETYQVSVAKADFRNAFVYGERTLGKNPLVKPEHTFLDMLRIKIDLQLEWLKNEGLITPADASSQKKEDIAQWSYRLTSPARFWNSWRRDIRWSWCLISTETSHPS